MSFSNFKAFDDVTNYPKNKSFSLMSLMMNGALFAKVVFLYTSNAVNVFSFVKLVSLLMNTFM